MADEPIAAAAEEGGPPPWRALWVSAAALLATLALIGLIVMITWSNRARDEALTGERRTYEVRLLTRNIDATIARSEAALGRYVLDENQNTGTAYYNEWRSAGWQITQLRRMVREDPDQARRVAELRELFQQRNSELGPAASAAERGQGSGGLSILYQAASSPTLRALRAKLEEIAEAEREKLARQVQQTRIFVARADAFTEWLGWLAILIGVGAVGLAILAVRSFHEGVKARREADSEAWRALELERAVRERTRELSEANVQLQAEMSERASAEAQLRQVQKMEAVGQLTGGIAHDFNNMLAVVVGGIDLARRRLGGPRREVQMHLENAMEGATRAAALTRRLLSFARSEPLMPEHLDSAALIKAMGDLLDRTLGERIQVATKFEGQAWPVFVDPHQLENAILNLAVNARDAMDGEGRLVIRSSNVTMAPNAVGDIQGGDYVRISVIDTGCGMTPEVAERAFEPFFTTKETGKGTGLGLSQIFGFAHQSGGEVGIESRVGKGSTVSIYLPRAAATGANVRIHPAAQRVDEDIVVKGARIMLVEDDPRVRTATVGALEDLGYQPVACASGEEAMRAFAGTHFDLVISDVIMPEMTGPELVRELRARRPDIAVLFVTGYVGEGETDDLVGYELLRKPFTVSALASSVAAALSKRPTEPLRTSGAAAKG